MQILDLLRVLGVSREFLQGQSACRTSVLQRLKRGTCDEPCVRIQPLQFHLIQFLRVVIGLAVLAGLAKGDSALAVEPDFNTQIRPILSKHCFNCHGPDAATREADLRLDNADSAKSVLHVEAGELSESEFVARLRSADPDQVMPPPDALHQLSDRDREQLIAWAQSGAEYKAHWAFAPPMRSPLPELSDSGWCRNPIDYFVLEKLRERQMEPAPQATSAELLRRIHFDLSGLPPSIERQDAFLAYLQSHDLELALQAEIARLMASRDYGEHMALPWLEAARYADTDGYQNDRYRYQHAWRDWVIRAFNTKMPYDQFVIEQLGGDLLPEATLWQQVATGFGRNHRINSEDGSIPEEWHVENVVDRVDTFGTVFLGLTIGCARCHDHKYDPISQREYYQLFAYFNNIAEHGVGPNNGNSPPFVELPASWPLLSAQENTAIVPEPVKLRNARKEAGNGLKRPQAGSEQTVMVMHELDKPRPTYVLSRGQYNAPDKTQRVQPNVPEILSAATRGTLSQPANRLELARWLMHPKHPLTARVAVNRLWQQFFGQGLVPTSENLGAQGALPSHPRLLDWLAVELVQSGWDLQHVQRLILNSATYRQTANRSRKQFEADPNNTWLSRGPRNRMSGFTLRDQALAVSGLLVKRTGGPSAKPYMPPKVWSAISNNKYKQDQGANLFRRSVYTYWRRTIPPPTMMNFNAAAREVCTVRNEVTNTPLQALSLMNNKAFVEAARHLATQALIEIPPAQSERDAELLRLRIRFVFRSLTSRQPSASEMETLWHALQDFEAYVLSSSLNVQKVLEHGESPAASQVEPSEQAILTLLASLIMNLDEAITK